MKGRLYILFFLLCLVSMVWAQKLELTDSLTYVRADYSFTIERPRSAYMVIYKPMLCGTTDTLSLDKVVVRGSSNEQISHRWYVLNKKNEPNYIRGKNIKGSITYSDTVRVNQDNSPWLFSEPITLAIDVVADGCCTTEQLGTYYSEPVPALRSRSVAQNTGDSLQSDAHHQQLSVPTFTPEFSTPTAYLPDVHAQYILSTNPVARPYSEYVPYDRTQILGRDTGALYVHYPVDQYVLLPEFSDNALILDSIIKLVNALIADSTTEVKVIQIVGLASVEGNTAHNEWLAGKRGLALEQYIRQHINSNDMVFENANAGEAWTEFRWYVENDEFEGRDQVLNILNSNTNLNVRKAKIKALGGTIWEHIKQFILPPLRNSGYVRVYYDVKPDEKGQIINDAVGLMREEQYADALALLQTVADDRRAQNALGTAYYMTGDRDNAIRCWRIAAEEGNTQAEQNLQNLPE